MRIRSVALLLTFALLFSAITSRIVACVVGQAAQETRPDRGTEPIVDSGSNPATNSHVRAARSQRHNKPQGHEFTELPPGVESYPETSHWHAHLPPLPVKESDAIVIATVSKSQAFLSTDRHYVYSEFELAVENALKNRETPAVQGATVTSERPGGAVRFPSGRITKIRINQQGFPQVGSRYVFFLKYQPATQDFFIVTGYRLDGGTVHPLDGVGFSTGASQFSKYAGTSEQEFVNDVLNAVTAEGHAK